MLFDLTSSAFGHKYVKSCYWKEKEKHRERKKGKLSVVFYNLLLHSCACAEKNSKSRQKAKLSLSPLGMNTGGSKASLIQKRFEKITVKSRTVEKKLSGRKYKIKTYLSCKGSLTQGVQAREADT